MEHIGSSSNAPQNHSSDSDDANNAKFTEAEIAWYKIRSDWVGDRSKRLQRQPRGPIKSGRKSTESLAKGVNVMVENCIKVCPSQTQDTSEPMKEMLAPSKDEARYIRMTSARKMALESTVLLPVAADIVSSAWKSAEYRKKMVTEMVEDCIRDRPYLSGDICGLTKSMKRSEAAVFASAKDKVEYMEMISIKKMEVQPYAERDYFLYSPEDHYHY